MNIFIIYLSRGTTPVLPTVLICMYAPVSPLAFPVHALHLDWRGVYMLFSRCEGKSLFGARSVGEKLYIGANRLDFRSSVAQCWIISQAPGPSVSSLAASFSTRTSGLSV